MLCVCLCACVCVWLCVCGWVTNQKNPTSQIQRDTLIYFHTSFTFRSRAVGKLNRVFHDEQHRSNWNMKLDDVWEIEMRNSSFLFLRRRLSVLRRRLKIDVVLSNVIWCPPTREFIDEIVQTSSSENRRKTRSDVVYFFWWTLGLNAFTVSSYFYKYFFLFLHCPEMYCCQLAFSAMSLRVCRFFPSPKW